LAGRAVDEVRRAEWRQHEKSTTASGRWVKGVRWSLLKAPERQTVRQLAALAEVQHANRPLYRAFLLKEELRMLYHLDDPATAPEHLKAWLAWASRSKLKPFVKLARTIRRYHDGILAAIRLGLSNARLEGLNSKVRLISHRSYGFHGPDPLIALIHLCAGGIQITLPPPPTREENHKSGYRAANRNPPPSSPEAGRGSGRRRPERRGQSAALRALDFGPVRAADSRSATRPLRTSSRRATQSDRVDAVHRHHVGAREVQKGRQGEHRRLRYAR
jgi:hypothetical protein